MGGPGLPPVLAGEDHAVGRLEPGVWLGGVQPPVHAEHARPVEALLLDKHALLSQPGLLNILLGKHRDNLGCVITPRSPPASQLPLVLQPLEADQAGVTAVV